MMRLTSLFKMPLKWFSNGSPSDLRQICTAKFPLLFKVSAALWAEPMKAKKRVDPAVLRAREERKKKRVEKLIRKRLKLNRQLKPVMENEVDYCLRDNLTSRQRTVNISSEVIEERTILLKKWSKFKNNERKNDIVLINRLINSQQVALNELRLESEELYQAAVKIDDNLIPMTFNGPVETPPIDNHPISDGQYIDTSRKWI